MTSMTLAIAKEGTITTIWGSPDAGKTNLAALFMKRMVELGYEVWTNIPFFKEGEIHEAKQLGRLPSIKGHIFLKKPEEVHTITKFSELIIGLLSTKEEIVNGKPIFRSRKNVVILDEAGVFASSSSPMSQQTKELKKMAFLIRHMNASLVIIAQSKGSVSPDLRERLVNIEIRIRKHKSMRTMTIAYGKPFTDEYGEEHMSFEPRPGDKFARIPLAPYPYDSKAFPNYKMDLDLEEVCDAIGGYNSIELLRTDDKGESYGVKLIKQMMEKKENEPNGVDKEAKKKRTLAFDYLAAGVKPKEIAKKLNISENQALQYQTAYRKLV